MMKDKSIVEEFILVEGDVQGVCFRSNTKRHATLLGLVGYVRNLPDGNVEIRVQGPSLTIQQLLHVLQNELYSKHIHEIRREELTTLGSYQDFKIL